MELKFCSMALEHVEGVSRTQKLALIAAVHPLSGPSTADLDAVSVDGNVATTALYGSKGPSWKVRDFLQAMDEVAKRRCVGLDRNTTQQLPAHRRRPAVLLGPILRQRLSDGWQQRRSTCLQGMMVSQEKKTSKDGDKRSAKSWTLKLEGPLVEAGTLSYETKRLASSVAQPSSALICLQKRKSFTSCALHVRASLCCRLGYHCKGCQLA